MLQLKSRVRFALHRAGPTVFLLASKCCIWWFDLPAPFGKVCGVPEMAGFIDGKIRVRIRKNEGKQFHRAIESCFALIRQPGARRHPHKDDSSSPAVRNNPPFARLVQPTCLFFSPHSSDRTTGKLKHAPPNADSTHVRHDDSLVIGDHEFRSLSFIDSLHAEVVGAAGAGRPA